MKQLFQYDPYKNYYLLGDLRILDAFSTDEEGNLYYWQKNLFRIAKLGAQIDGNKEQPKDFVIPYILDSDPLVLTNNNDYMVDVRTFPSAIKWHVYPHPKHKQAKIARECIRYIADRKYIEKIMYYNKEAQAAERISTVLSISGDALTGTKVEYISSDEKRYGVVIGKKIQNYDLLMDLLRNYNVTRMNQSVNDYYF